MPWQCSFKKLCFFAPIMPKMMLAQSAKAWLFLMAISSNKFKTVIFVGAFFVKKNSLRTKLLYFELKLLEDCVFDAELNAQFYNKAPSSLYKHAASKWGSVIKMHLRRNRARGHLLHPLFVRVQNNNPISPSYLSFRDHCARVTAMKKAQSRTKRLFWD